MNPQPLFKETVTVQNEQDVGQLRRLVNGLANKLKMAALNRTKLITATSELVRNLLKYGGGGQVTVEAVSQNDNEGIRLTFNDNGPGIPDINLVMQDGYSTGKTLGIGLPGTKRLVDEFNIRSEVNKGTTVVITKWIHG